MNAFFFFRDTPVRQRLLREDSSGTIDRTPLLGYDELSAYGWTLACNLAASRRHPWLDRLVMRLDPWYSRRTGTGLGDVESAWSRLHEANQADVVVSTSCYTGLPLAHLRRIGWLKRPLIYVSIGLPERLNAMARVNPRAHSRYLNSLSASDHYIAFGWAEAAELRNRFRKPVSFIPFGVDTGFFQPQESENAMNVDILSIGADGQRDFALLLDYARSHPLRSIRLIISAHHARQLGVMPDNIQVLQDLPIREVRRHIASAGLVVLPVCENTYSGATTTLLQCLAMSKPVAVSEVGAIREGYGFQDGRQLRFFKPGDITGMSATLDEMLANPAQNAILGVNARNHVLETLNWPRFVKELDHIMRTVAG